MNIKSEIMQEVSTNPLKTLDKDELNEFRNAIDKNFGTLEVKGRIIEDYHKKWSELHSQCVKYAYWNHKTITIGYPENIDNRTYGDIVKIMINEELQRR